MWVCFVIRQDPWSLVGLLCSGICNFSWKLLPTRCDFRRVINVIQKYKVTWLTMEELKSNFNIHVCKYEVTHLGWQMNKLSVSFSFWKANADTVLYKDVTEYWRGQEWMQMLNRYFCQWSYRNPVRERCALIRDLKLSSCLKKTLNWKLGLL